MSGQCVAWRCGKHGVRQQRAEYDPERKSFSTGEKWRLRLECSEPHGRLVRGWPEHATAGLRCSRAVLRETNFRGRGARTCSRTLKKQSDQKEIAGSRVGFRSRHVHERQGTLTRIEVIAPLAEPMFNNLTRGWSGLVILFVV